ncbi:MAG: M14 family metallopeptidase [Pseudomonadota bacterium]
MRLSTILILATTTLLASCTSIPQYAGSCENEYAVLDAEFEGARVSGCKAEKTGFRIQIDPEDKPINPSPWYAFRVTPKQVGDITVEINYSHAAHRYRPKRSEDATRWRLVDEARVSEMNSGKRVALRLSLGDEPFFISAQELLLTGAYEKWINDLIERVSLESRVIGESVEKRQLIGVFSKPEPGLTKKEHVLLIGRQHPPELTGAFAMQAFVETVFADTTLSSDFRNRFHITVIPLLNPDGVVHGHWRHNMNGVDLNRDWGPFTQPETQAVKRLLDDIASEPDSELRLMLDFHSTNRNVFYVQPDEDETVPPRFVADWIDAAPTRLPQYDFERADRFQTALATSKNYVYGRFGAPGITYELGDQTDRQLIDASARVFAQEMMQTLLASDSSLEDKAKPSE